MCLRLDTLYDGNSYNYMLQPWRHVAAQGTFMARTTATGMTPEQDLSHVACRVTRIADDSCRIVVCLPCLKRDWSHAAK